MVEVVQDVGRAGPDINQTTTNSMRERVLTTARRDSIPHSYKSVLPQSVSCIRDNFDGGIVDLHLCCLARPANYQLLLLTAVTLDHSSGNKHNAMVMLAMGEMLDQCQWDISRSLGSVDIVQC